MGHPLARIVADHGHAEADHEHVGLGVAVIGYYAGEWVAHLL